MSVLDRFYLLFETDIPQKVEKEISGLDKQIDELARKGKKRTDEENKQYLELQKRRKEAVADLKNMQQETDKVSNSFADLARNGLAALTGFATFAALKTGITDAARLNNSLEVLSMITGQNANELRAYSAAIEGFGGDAQSFVSSVYSMTQAAAQNGITFTKVGQLFDYYHEKIKGLPKGEQLRILSLGGVTDPAVIALLEQTDDEYRKIIRDTERLTNARDDDYQSARRYTQAQADFNHVLTQAFTHLGSDVLPYASLALDKFVGHIKELEKQKGGVETFFVETATAAIAIWSPLFRVIYATIFLLDRLRDIPKIPKAIEESSEGAAYKVLKSVITGKNQFSKGKPAPAGGPQSTGNDSVDFWLSQGYTLEQAEGIAANEKAESNGRPGARNYAAGVHYGLYQWSEARRRAILAGTGIDVARADANSQRKAAAWELHQRGDDLRVMGAKTSNEATVVFNSNFERSGEDPARRIAIDNQIAASIAASGTPISSGANKSVNVKIDDINIHVPSGDPDVIAQRLNQSIIEHMEAEYHTASSDLDDGIDR